jgi:hypothetical protein
MALFVEVTSVDKDCKVILNLDHIIEIAPLVSGGCAIFMADGAGMNSKTSMKVKEDYELFKQFAMQTVTADDIAKRFPKKEKVASVVKPQEEGKGVEIDVPVFGTSK